MQVVAGGSREPRRTPDAPAPRSRVLNEIVVDDEPLLVQLFEDALAEAGFQVITASTADAATNDLQERSEANRASDGCEP